MTDIPMPEPISRDELKKHLGVKKEIPEGVYILKELVVGAIAVGKDSRLWVKFDPKFFGHPQERCWYDMTGELPYPGMRRVGEILTAEELWSVHHAMPLYSLRQIFNLTLFDPSTDSTTEEGV